MTSTSASACEEFAEDYSALLDGELGAARAAQVRARSGIRRGIPAVKRSIERGKNQEGEQRG